MFDYQHENLTETRDIIVNHLKSTQFLKFKRNYKEERNVRAIKETANCRVGQKLAKKNVESILFSFFAKRDLQVTWRAWHCAANTAQ